MKDLYKGQRIVVMGLGLHGGGVAIVKWLSRQGASIIVTDLKTKKELQSSVDALKKIKVKYVLGKHRVEDFKKADLVIQNPGVPRDSKFLQIAKKAGIPIENDASLFFKYCQGVIIGVTGTRGKSTTASLIHAFIKSKTTWLAGLSGKPMMDILDKVKEGDVVVLELSSWQLEILGQQKLSPEVCVVTNIYPDHLNRYAGMKSYILAKKNIYKNQTNENIAVLNFDNSETRSMGKEVPSTRFWFSKKDFSNQNGSFVKNNKIYFRQNGIEKLIAQVKDINLAGEHNLENTLAAICVAKNFKADNKNIVKVLRSFKSLSGRIELVKVKSQVSYVNDTTSTTPDATIAALKSFSKKNIILIAGGDTKKIPLEKYKELSKLIDKKCKAVVLLSGQGSKQILKTINSKKVVSGINDMTEAVAIANSFSKKGDVVLLSPACASFNLFDNEFDRGDQFSKVVSNL